MNVRDCLKLDVRQFKSMDFRTLNITLERSEQYFFKYSTV